MSKGDRVRLVRLIKWDGKVYTKGTVGKVVRCGSSGYFIDIKGTEIYAFREEVTA